jgi:Dolichyl-phosphate-mannose-protein mannosyltransferase
VLGAAIAAHRVELLATAALLCLYLALMNGHLITIDGLVMWRQALSLTYHQSLTFVPPIWWGGVITTSSRGLGASLEYVPGLAALPFLSGSVPAPPPDSYDFKLLYGDLLYLVAGAPVWAVITAVTAYLVFLTTRALGLARNHAVWAMAFFALGSPAFMAARGDTPQPLVALTWALGVYACLKYREASLVRWLWIAAASIAYGVLARPLEGSLILPGLLILLWPAWRKTPTVANFPIAGWAIGVAITLLVNQARFGSLLDFGYGGSVAWSTPIWVGLPGALVSPGRGLLWEFPAIFLAAAGTVMLWRSGGREVALALAGVPAVLLIESCQYFDWVGGWDWGFRFFQPALPLVAVLAGAALPGLPKRVAGWLPAVLLAGGILWNIPAVSTDLLGGYGVAYAEPAANWRLDAYPPIGAWQFVNHIVPRSTTDSAAFDNVWFRATVRLGKAALIPFAILLIAAITFGRSALLAQRQAPPAGS